MVSSTEETLIWNKMRLCIGVFVYGQVCGHMSKYAWGVFQKVWPKVTGINESESEVRILKILELRIFRTYK